jgi:hypothetical protein
MTHLRVYQSIVGDDLQDIVQNCNPRVWKEIFVVLVMFEHGTRGKHLIASIFTDTHLIDALHISADAHLYLHFPVIHHLRHLPYAHQGDFNCPCDANSDAIYNNLYLQTVEIAKGPPRDIQLYLLAANPSSPLPHIDIDNHPTLLRVTPPFDTLYIQLPHHMRPSL